MNAAALGVWWAMGKRTHIIDAQRGRRELPSPRMGFLQRIADTRTMLFAYQIADRAHFDLALPNRRR
jgi:hypothetical protein